jgi:hypothetical protein
MRTVDLSRSLHQEEVSGHRGLDRALERTEPSMNNTARRALRAGVSVVGLAALGASLTGTAYAATGTTSVPEQAQQQDPAASLPNAAPSSSTGGAQNLHSFELPTATSTPGATSMPASNPLTSSDSDDSDSDDSCGPSHAAHDYSFGYDGDKSDDQDYDSDDEDADCTGFQGDDPQNGYNGYNGTDKDRQDENHYRFAPL